MAGGDRFSRIDEPVARRLAAMSPGSQRWLKTVLHTIATAELVEVEAEEERSRAPARPAVVDQEEAPPRAASLEDVITGEADLRDHLSSYPELAQELDGLADIIDMLREAGEQRRKRGEQVFRKEILGEEPESEDGGETA